MITVLSTPPLVALSENPVRFTLQSDNFLESSGIKPTFTLVFESVGSVGNSWTLRWGVNSLTFTCVSNPDDSGLQVPDGSLIPDLYTWVANIARYLALNYYIARDFTVYATQSLIKFEARNFGDEYEISLESNGSLSGYNSGVAPVPRPFYKLGIQLVLKLAGVWTTVAEDLLPVDNTGLATFDVHVLFADYLTPGFTFPEADSLMNLHPDTCREYRIRYFEQYGVPIRPSILQQTDSFYILKGGISQLQYLIDTRKGTSWWEKETYSKRFLTWITGEILTGQDSTIKLYHMVQAAAGQINLKVEVNYNDNAPQALLTPSTIDSVPAKTVIELCVGPRTLQLPGYSSGTIDYYRVWLEDGDGNTITEIRTLRMDYIYHEFLREFLYLNSLGGYDTLRATGLQEDDLQYDRTSIDRDLTAATSEQEHLLATLSVAERQTYKANTGWLTIEAASAVRDFLVSKQVYLVENGRLVPVVITTSQVTQKKDGEDLRSIDFEYQRSFENLLYTRDIPSGSFNDDYNDDFDNV